MANADGTLKQELSYDAWGRLRNPATQVVYTPGTEPALFLGRDYTGHEHLAPFGLINMNARLYDAALGRFLSLDPYVQMPDFTQNFNRYAYCLNNPLIYTDLNGEWYGIDDIISFVVGGIVNWGLNGFKFSSEGLSYFGAGCIGGIATLYTAVGGAALTSSLNSIISQGFSNGWENINCGQVTTSGIIGGATSYLGSQLGDAISKPISKITSKITSPVVKEAITQSATNAVTGFGLGVGFAWGSGADFKEGLKQGEKGALAGAGIGLMTGTVAGVKYAKSNNVNPWTGKANATKSTSIEVTSSDLNLSSTVERIKNGESFPHRNDGKVFENRENILPQKAEGYYKEYVHPTTGIRDPGSQRIVIGGGNEWYYSPDHYKTFIRFKP